jgi:hypothetical protein
MVRLIICFVIVFTFVMALPVFAVNLHEETVGNVKYFSHIGGLHQSRYAATSFELLSSSMFM